MTWFSTSFVLFAAASLGSGCQGAGPSTPEAASSEQERDAGTDGADADPDGADPDPGGAADPQISVHVEPVLFRLAVDGGPTIDFDMAYGLEFERAAPFVPGGAVVSAAVHGFSSLVLEDGTAAGPEDVRALAAWYEAIASFHEVCEELEAAGCRDAWQRADLTRDAVLTAQIGEEELIARWDLAGVWPSAQPVQHELTHVVQQRVVAEVRRFAFASTDRMTRLFGRAPVPVPYPIRSGADGGDSAWQELEWFSAAYHGPAAALARLDSLEALAEEERARGDELVASRVRYSSSKEDVARFTVELYTESQGGKTIIGGFQKMSGMDSESEVIELPLGSDHLLRARPGPRRPEGRFAFEIGKAPDHALSAWFAQVLTGEEEARSGALVVRDRSGTERLRFGLVDARPLHLTPPAASPGGAASGNDVSIEKLTIAVEGLERD